MSNKIEQVIIASDGDALLILINPAGTDPTDDIELQVHFRVSSNILSDTSTYFHNILDGRFQTPVAHDDGLLHFTLDEDFDTEAMTLLLLFLHGLPAALPCDQLLDLLVEMGIVVDFLSLYRDAVTSASREWVAQVSRDGANNLRPRLPLDGIFHAEDVPKWLFVVIIFWPAREFEAMLHAMINGIVEPLPTEDLGLPITGLLERINHRRSEGIKAGYAKLQPVRDKLERREFGCGGDCAEHIRSQMERSMVRFSPVFDLSLQPMQGPHYTGVSLPLVTQTVNRILNWAAPAYGGIPPSYPWFRNQASFQYCERCLDDWKCMVPQAQVQYSHRVLWVQDDVEDVLNLNITLDGIPRI